MTAIGNVSQTNSVTPALTHSVGTSSSTEASSLLPEPQLFSGNTAITLAMLMTRADQLDQQSSTKVQDASDGAAAAAEQQRVDQMQDKASKDEDQALASGLGEVASGGLALAGAMGTPTATDASRKLGDSLTAGSKAATGIGTIVAGQYKAGADRDDASAARFQAAADASVRRYNAAQNEAQAAAASIQKTEEVLQGILQTEASANVKAAGG